MPLPIILITAAGILAGKESEKTKTKKKRSAAAKKGAATRKANAANKKAGR